MTESLYSVGIDIGTTTTHMVISRLHLDNSAKFQEAPRLKFSRKEIVYASPISFTPTTADGMIDAERIRSIVANEYESAQIKPDDIAAGALIITGESAKLRNAEQVAHALSDYAGNFVVASAGPNLESILAARGSGAISESKTTGKTICNVDIGGGTVNCAVIKNGQIIDNACLGIGGRCIRFRDDGSFVSATNSAKILLDDLRELETLRPFAKTEGDTCARANFLQVVEPFTNIVAETIINFVFGRFDRSIDLLHSQSSLGAHVIDEFWISGGVGALMEQSSRESLSSATRISEIVQFGDLGLLLGECAGSEL